jgi:hypothetical protein
VLRQEATRAFVTEVVPVQRLFATKQSRWSSAGWRVGGDPMSVVSRERSRPMTHSRSMTFTIRAAECVLKSAPITTYGRGTFRRAVADGREGPDRSIP